MLRINKLTYCFYIKKNSLKPFFMNYGSRLIGDLMLVKPFDKLNVEKKGFYR